MQKFLQSNCQQNIRNKLYSLKNQQQYLSYNNNIQNLQIKNLNHQNQFSFFKAAEFYKKYVPEKYYPYVELGRYEKPIGYMLLFWPCTWGIALGMPYFQPLQFMHMFGTFLTGSIVMRAAGCAINDMWDKDLDNKVLRTQSRPLASGKLNYKQASMFLAAHLSMGLGVLTQLNWYSIALAFGIIPCVVIYPYMKRISYYPQFVLGLCFNWGVIVAYATMQNQLDLGIALPAYLAGIQWTLIYDTIYGHQDKVDDIKVGVKSTALAWGDKSKQVMTGLNIGQMMCLATTGYFSDFGMSYYIMMLLGQMRLQYLINKFDMDDPKSCGQTFVSNSQYGAYILIVFLISQYLKQNNNSNKNNKIDNSQN